MGSISSASVFANCSDAWVNCFQGRLNEKWAGQDGPPSQANQIFSCAGTTRPSGPQANRGPQVYLSLTP